MLVVLGRLDNIEYGNSFSSSWQYVSKTFISDTKQCEMIVNDEINQVHPFLNQY